jgi:hypothetical protein
LGEFTQLPYRATIMIDGLKKSEQNYFSSGLRISVHKVRGINDQVDEFIEIGEKTPESFSSGDESPFCFNRLTLCFFPVVKRGDSF